MDGWRCRATRGGLAVREGTTNRYDEAGTGDRKQKPAIAGLYFLNLVQGSDALRAQVLPRHLIPVKHFDVLDVGIKASLGPVFGVAHVVADLGGLAAMLALCHELACLI